MIGPILIGCEESQTICKAFRDAGFEAYSCDLQPTRGNPAWHFQQDILKVIPTRRWLMIILHPDCTAMAVSGNRWYGTGMPRHNERLTAVTWTLRLWDLAKEYSDYCALENPVSVIFTYLSNVFYLQPHEYGHGETKKTGFALHNLPPLVPTNRVAGREQRVWKMPPSETRKRDRSKTFDGVAQAIVQQWGKIVLDSTKQQQYNNHTITEGKAVKLSWWYHPESESYFQASYADMEHSMKNGEADAYMCNEVDEEDVPEQFKQEQPMSKCSICSETQFMSVLGPNCSNGHLNAPAQERVALEGTVTQDNQMVARLTVGEDLSAENSAAVTAPASEQVPVDKLVKIYVKIRDALGAARKDFEKVEAEYKEKMAMVATELKARAQLEGVDGFKTEFGTVYLSETMKTSCADWAVFGEFLKTHDPLEFMEKRISSTAVKEYMKQNEGQLPPGVSIFKEIEARVRRAGEK